MKITHSAGGVVVGSDGRILIVHQNGNSWSLPKGHLEPGETPIQAARREIAEEAGLDSLEYVGDLGSYDRYRIGLNGCDDEQELKKITLFLFRTRQKELRPADPHVPLAAWMTKEDVLQHLTHPADRDFFSKITTIF